MATWGDKYARDTAWKQVTEEIGKVAKQIRDKRVAEFNKAQKAEAKKEFRAKAQDSYRDYYDDGGLDSTAKRLLERERKRLGLEEPEAREILQGIEAKRQQHQDNLAEYREELAAKLADRSELTVKQGNLLQRFQADLGISSAHKVTGYFTSQSCKFTVVLLSLSGKRV